jgi:hypothetical protein
MKFFSFQNQNETRSPLTPPIRPKTDKDRQKLGFLHHSGGEAMPEAEQPQQVIFLSFFFVFFDFQKTKW